MHISAPPAARPVGPGKFGDRDRGPRAGGCGAVRAGGAARLGADLRVYISAPPAAPPQDPQEDRGAGLVCERKEELLDSERELRVDTCTVMQRHASRHRLPRDPQRDRAICCLSGCHDSERVRSGVCSRLGGAARLGTDLRVYMCVIGRPRCPRLPRGRRSCFKVRLSDW